MEEGLSGASKHVKTCFWHIFYFNGGFMARYDGSIRINTKIDSKEASAQLMALQNRIVKAADKIDSLRSKMDSLKKAKVPTKEYAGLENELKRLTVQYDKTAERQYRFLSTGGREGTSTYKRMEYDLEALDKKQDEVIAKMKQLESSGKAFTLGIDTEEYAKLSQQLKYAKNDFDVLIARQKEFNQKNGDSQIDGYKRLSKEISDLTSKYNKFSSMSESIKKTFSTSDVSVSGYDKLNNSLDELKRKMSNVSKIFRGSFDGIKNIAENTKNSVVSGFAKVETAARNASRSVTSNFSSFKKDPTGTLRNALDRLTVLEVKASKNIAAAAKNSATSLLKGVSSSIGSTIGKIGGFAANAGSSIKSGLGSALDVVKEKAAGFAGSTINGLLHPFQTLKNVAGPSINKVSNLIENGLGAAMEAIKQKAAGMSASIINGFVHPFQTLKNVALSSGNKIKSMFSKMSSVVKKVGSGIKKFGGFIKKAFSGLSKESQKSQMSLGKMLATSLLFSTAFKAISAVSNGIKEGMTNLAQYSEKTNSSISMLMSALTQLKNSLATAFAPILNVVAPILTSFINMLSKAATYIGMLIASLTGQKTFEKAVGVQQDYAASLKGSADAAKEAEKAAEGYLSPLDEINKFEKKDTSKDTDKAGKGAGTISPEDMFETVDIPSNVSEMANRIKEVLSGIWDVFNQAWESKGKKVIDSAKSAIGSLKESVLSIGRTFYDVFTNGTGLTWLESSFELLRSILDIIGTISTAFSIAWNSGAGFENVTALFNMFTNINTLLTSIGDSFSRVFSNGTGVSIWTNILGIITGVYNIVGNLAASLREAWDTAGVGDSIWQGILNIFNSILGTIHNIVDSTAEWAGKLDFTPLLTSIDTLLKSLEPLTDNIGAGLEWFWNNILLPISGWVIQEALPTFLNMISAALDALNVIIEIFKPLGEWLWNEFLQPLGEWTGSIIIGAMETITGLLTDFTNLLTENGNAAEIGAGIVDTLSGAWKNLMDVLSPIGEFLSGVFTSIWNDMLEPALSWIGNTVIPILIDTFSNLWNKVLVPLGEYLSAIFSPIIRIVSELFSMLWKKIIVPLAQFIRESFSKAWEGFHEILNKTVIPIVNKVIKVATFLWKNVLSPIVDFLWGVLKPAFSQVFDGIGGVINGIKKIFSGLIDFVVGIFTLDWEKAWNGVKEIFSGIWDTFSTVVKSPLNLVIALFEGLANKIIDAWNWIKKQINSLSFDVPDWVPGIGGEKFGFNLKMSSHTKIPRLATGTVVPPNREFLAMLGDNKREPEVVSPLSTIEQAVKNAMSQMGGTSKEIVIKVPVYLDGKQIYESVIKQGKVQQMSTGSNGFMLGTT